jgi:hypothetical protein
MFENFLKKNRIYKKYFDNIDKCFITEHYINYVNERKLFEIPKTKNKKELIYNVLTPITFLQYSFDWEKSKQGHMFWEKFNEKWIKHYMEFINNIH